MGIPQIWSIRFFVALKNYMALKYYTFFQSIPRIVSYCRHYIQTTELFIDHTNQDILVCHKVQEYYISCFVFSKVYSRKAFLYYHTTYEKCVLLQVLNTNKKVLKREMCTKWWSFLLQQPNSVLYNLSQDRTDCKF